MNFNLDPYNENNVREWIENLIESKSYVGRIVDNKTADEIFEHFKYNRQLVSLDERSYPESVYEIMCNYLDYECCKDTKTIEERLEAQKNDVEDIINDIF